MTEIDCYTPDHKQAVRVSLPAPSKNIKFKSRKGFGAVTGPIRKKYIAVHADLMRDFIRSKLNG